jgi:hypothetical protein
MCYFIHAALLGEVKDTDLNAINSKHKLHISKGTKHELKEALLNANWNFRVTDDLCDCKSEIGGGDPSSAQVCELASIIAEISSLPEAKRLSLCKAWAGKSCKSEHSFKLSEIKLNDLISAIEPDTLYTLMLKS